MQAIILAAGMGKRLKQLTQNATKCMVEVNGVPMIDRMLFQLEKKNLSRIIMVVGYEAEKLKKHVIELGLKTPVQFVINDIYDRTNNIYSLYLASEMLQEEDTVLLESDLIFEECILDKIIENPYPSLALVAKFERWMDGTVVTLNEEDRIVGMYSKKEFNFNEVSHYYKTVNIYKFSKEFSKNQYIPFLEAYCKVLGNNEYYEQVLKIITMLEKTELKALRLEHEKWYEIDDIQDLDIAESIFLEGEERFSKMQKRYGGYWRYPEIIDFCYLVNPYYPCEKMLDEIGTNMKELICNYPSGQDVNSLLAAKYFGLRKQNICIGNGAAEIIKALMERVEGKVGMIYPSFQEYGNRLTAERRTIFYPPDYTYGINDLILFFENNKVDNIVLINPDNPSGNYITYKDILVLCDWCQKRSIKLFVDESFADFSEEEMTLMQEDVLEQYPNLYVIKSLSKSYGMPGIRLGVMAAKDVQMISYIKKNLAIWNINSFGEFFMQIVEKYEKEYRESLKMIREERNYLTEELKKLNLEVYPSQANYIMCCLKNMSSKQLAILLLEKQNLLIKDLSEKEGFAGKNFIRIAVRNREDNQKLVEGLGQYL